MKQMREEQRRTVQRLGADKEATPRKTEHHDKIKGQVTPQPNLGHAQLYRNAMGPVHLVDYCSRLMGRLIPDRLRMQLQKQATNLLSNADGC